MARADRAMQFMPFAALKGFEEALRAKETVKVEKSELSDEMLEFLDYKLSSIKVGEIVTIIYYDGLAYIRKTGMLSKINRAARCLTVVTTDISFDDIKDIQV